jgi:PhnB protein
MLADASEDRPAIPAHVHIYVPDVDATYQRALAAGATSVQKPQEPPQRSEDDSKRGGVKDAGGTTWWIATKVV